MKRILIKLIKKWMFGTPINGTPAYPEPKFKTTIPDSYGLSFEEWLKVNNISKRAEHENPNP